MSRTLATWALFALPQLSYLNARCGQGHMGNVGMRWMVCSCCRYQKELVCASLTQTTTRSALCTVEKCQVPSRTFHDLHRHCTRYCYSCLTSHDIGTARHLSKLFGYSGLFHGVVMLGLAVIPQQHHSHSLSSFLSPSKSSCDHLTFPNKTEA